MRPLAISDKMWMDVKSQFISKGGLDNVMNEIYDALSKDDLSESVMVVLNKLEHLTFKKEEKSEIKSIKFRMKGNTAFAARKLQDALVSYNQALLYAPPQSLVLKLAYSNRSAVFLKGSCASSCIKDIDTCFALGCPDDIKEKLKKRRIQALNLVRNQRLAALMQEDHFSDFFFDLKQKSFQIPCCSSDVEVIIENNLPKIIARKNIKAGSVLAVETAFVSETELENVHYSCSYCHKMALNLLPCEGCTYALYCNAECEKLAMQDYHKIECVIGDLDIPQAYNKMIFKAALKIRSKCSTWKEFIDASNTMGTNRIKNSTVTEIFCENEKFSLLNFQENRPFVVGPRSSFSVLVALLIENLKKVAFFPTDHLEMQAIQAFARVLMYLYLYLPKTQKRPSVASIDGLKMLHIDTNFGVFSFISKIKNACPGNCITIDLNKKQALVAMYPIKAGTELSIPFCDPWTTITPAQMYSLYNTVGGCNICMGEKGPSDVKYTKIQEKVLLQYIRIGIQTTGDFNASNVEEIFKFACGYMPLFSDVAHTFDYLKLVYATFRKCLLHIQDKVSNNIVLDKRNGYQ